MGATEAQRGNTGTVGIVTDLFENRTTLLCSEEKLQSYADFLGIKVKTKVKKCNSMVPEKFEYKSAQDLRTLLVEKNPEVRWRSFCALKAVDVKSFGQKIK